VTQARPFDRLRERAGAARVTNVELFFDLVYVFAVRGRRRPLGARSYLRRGPVPGKVGGDGGHP
jgi:hypothetical protein